MSRTRVTRAAFVVAGSVFLLLGIVGAFLPLLPTTPFLLLAAACYVRGSQRAYDRLLAHPVLGPPIKAFRDGRGITKRTKIAAIATMWGSMAISIIVVAHPVATAALVVIGTAVTAYLLSLPTARRSS